MQVYQLNPHGAIRIINELKGMLPSSLKIILRDHSFFDSEEDLRKMAEAITMLESQ
jgi:hypothetical protein